MSFKVKVRSNWFGEDAKAALQAGGTRSVRLALNVLIRESKQQVPLDKGPLKASAVADQDGLQGTISYDTPYAVRQHEEMGYNHQRGRKAKYLEDPVNDPSLHAEIMQAIVSEVGKELR